MATDLHVSPTISDSHLLLGSSREKFYRPKCDSTLSYSFVASTW